MRSPSKRSSRCKRHPHSLRECRPASAQSKNLCLHFLETRPVRIFFFHFLTSLQTCNVDQVLENLLRLERGQFESVGLAHLEGLRPLLLLVHGVVPLVAVVGVSLLLASCTRCVDSLKEVNFHQNKN